MLINMNRNSTVVLIQLQAFANIQLSTFSEKQISKCRIWETQVVSKVRIKVPGPKFNYEMRYHSLEQLFHLVLIICEYSTRNLPKKQFSNFESTDMSVRKYIQTCLLIVVEDGTADTIQMLIICEYSNIYMFRKTVFEFRIL